VHRGDVMAQAHAHLELHLMSVYLGGVTWRYEEVSFSCIEAKLDGVRRTALSFRLSATNCRTFCMMLCSISVIAAIVRETVLLLREACQVGSEIPFKIPGS
jgi:hypothetical protein